MRQRTGQIF